jgi:NADH:ubiquinone oxidoreductase subunit B-like Fe-S oxidoreductase
MDHSLVRLYEQMLEPKYIIDMGACTVVGFHFDRSRCLLPVKAVACCSLVVY